MITKILAKNIWSGELGWIGTELWVQNGVIVDPKSVADKHYEVLNLADDYLYPAFRDGHCHPIFAGREAAGIDVSNCASVQEICSVVATTAETDSSEWLEGGAYDRSLIENGAFQAAWLDAVVSDRPVVLHASDHHTIWVNTKAMEVAGIFDLPSFEIEGGSIDLDADNRPTGVFREWAAMNLVLSQIPARSLDDEIAALEWAHERLLQSGIVQVQDAWIDRGMCEIYIAAAKQKRLRVATNLGFRFTPETWTSDVGYFLACKDEVDELGHRLLTADCAKFFLDGILGSGTAAVLEPYLSAEAESQDSTGDLVWTADSLFEAAKTASLSGLQLHFHAIGDAAVRLALDTFEKLRKSGVELVRSPVIAHAELVAKEDIPRFRELAVIANFQPLWARKDGMLTSCVAGLGWDRVNRMYPMRSFEIAQAMFSFGSDWPVSSCEPLKGLATATTRMTPEGLPEGGWVPEQRISLQTAWRAYSEGVALQLGNASGGSLAVGSQADLLALPVNCFEVAPLSLSDLKVSHLVVAGELIY